MRRTTGAALLLAVVAATNVRAQIGPEEQARRLLEDGRAAWRDGKLKQALDNFNTIASGFSGTSSVDDALLEIGRYHYEVDRNAARAREAFEQVAKRYPQSDGAPGAYWQLGWLALGSAKTVADLDDAVAQFGRVQRLYPRSEWVPKALHASAIAHRRAARLGDAALNARRVVLEYPTSDAAPAAQLELGQVLALLGRPHAAMEAFQEVRNRWPASDLGREALDRITALWRLHGSSKPLFQVDASWSVGAGDVLKGVRALLADRGGNLWIASEKVSAAVPFSPEGKMGASYNAQDPRALTLTPLGEIVFTSRTAVRVGARDVRTFSVPGDKPGVLEPLDKINAAAVVPGTGVLVADEKRKRVFLFDDASKFVSAYPDAGEREVTRIVLDSEGSILMLDHERRSITVLDRAGKLVRVIGPVGAGYNLRKPVDIAVDAFRNLYVADEELGVFVLAPDGKLLAHLQAAEARKPRAITVDQAGSVLVYDDKTQRVVRFR